MHLFGLIIALIILLLLSSTVVTTNALDSGLGWGNQDQRMWAYDIAADNSGHVFVLDSIIHKYTHDGHLVKEWGNPEFTVYSNVAVDSSNGYVYVTSVNKVLKFTTNGVPLPDIVNPEILAGSHIAIDPVDGYVYVAGVNGILKFTSDGELKSKLNNIGNLFAVDSSGFIYDVNGNHVRKFDSTGEPVPGKEWSSSRLDYSMDIAIDSYGYIYLAQTKYDNINDRVFLSVFRFSNEGVFVKEWSWGTEYSSIFGGYLLGEIIGITTDGTDLYVLEHSFMDNDLWDHFGKQNSWTKVRRFHTKNRVVLDPGHCEDHPGGGSTAKHREDELCLDIAMAAKVKLESLGYDVILTRETDACPNVDNLNLTPDDGATVSARDCTRLRTKIANEENCDIFVSIHCNANNDKTKNGIETYYYKYDPEVEPVVPQTQETSAKSYRLAEIVQDSILGIVNIRDGGVKLDTQSGPKSLWVCRQSKMPAVLVEVAYATNSEDAIRLNSANFRNLAGFGIAEGINEYAQQQGGRVRTFCPVDLEVVDPDGFEISKLSNEISGASYDEFDFDYDGESEDEIIIPDLKEGNYIVKVIPEPDALPTDTFSLEVTIWGETVVLAENVKISDIPSSPYIFVVEDDSTPIDLTPPNLEVHITPGVLWPANHKYVDVFAVIDVSDDIDPQPVVELVSVTSSEPDDALGKGAGHTTEDIIIGDSYNFKLRAERDGSGTGRTYTITYKATDASGNSAYATVSVLVPHDNGKK